MKMLIICSKNFYNDIPEVKKQLQEKGIEVFLPNCFRQSEDIIRKVDSVLVLNFNKQTDTEILNNYIGGVTFLQMYDAFRLNKKIYLYNEIPRGILFDEIQEFGVEVINKDLSKIELTESFDVLEENFDVLEEKKRQALVKECWAEFEEKFGKWGR